MGRKCLITGAGGFIGQYLAEELLQRGCEVHALDVRLPPAPEAGAERFKPGLLDVRDAAQTLRAIHSVQPAMIFHLAAQSYPGLSWEQPALTYDVNVLGTVHVLEAARKLTPAPKTLVVCSSAEYAVTDGADPISEETELAPSTPYGVSKLAEDHLALLYHQQYGLPTVRVRPFFLIGPRKRGDVCSDFARGIVAIERGQAQDLRVGNLEMVRDMLDVRDGAAAFWTLAEHGADGEVYNVCSGKGYSLKTILETYRSLSTAQVRESVDAARLRPLDEKIRIGDPGRLMALGWNPSRSIERTLADILSYWREEAGETPCKP